MGCGRARCSSESSAKLPACACAGLVRLAARGERVCRLSPDRESFDMLSGRRLATTLSGHFRLRPEAFSATQAPLSAGESATEPLPIRDRSATDPLPSNLGPDEALLRLAQLVDRTTPDFRA